MIRTDLLDELLEYSPSIIEAGRLYAILDSLDNETQNRIAKEFNTAFDFLVDQMEVI